MSDLVLRIEDLPHGADRRLALLSGATLLHSVDIDAEERFCWFRLILETTKAVAASFSFAEPDGRRPAGASAPLLLLAPEAPGIWAGARSAPVKVRAGAPRVGYADFVRWMANADLKALAYPGVDPDAIDEFHSILAIANRMRHLSTELSQHLDTLPDPAVAAIRLELHQTDTLSGALQRPAAQTFDLTNSLALFLTTDIGGHHPPTWTPQTLLERIFRPLDDRFSFDVTIAPDTTLALSRRFLATVPAGCVAELGMHAVVRQAHFQGADGHPSVFHPGLLQHALRATADAVVFTASALRIETMFDGIATLSANDHAGATALAGAMIEAVPIANTRRFDIMSKSTVSAADRNAWRLIGEIDVITQRWRPSGRPIYNLISPRAHAAGRSDDPHPAVPLVAQPGEALAQFEREAFFDRPDIDAHSITQRMSPLPSRTVLQEHPWDAPSATYFRHRFRLRSRYAGALKSQQSVDAWRDETAHLATAVSGWTMRVAMLADLSRLMLTRPQLRALIPLTTTPAGESGRQPAPPVAAVLQEPPFARGGLADRIAAEIKTGFGYGFPPSEDERDQPPVEIRDARKEAGPNPNLDYKPFSAETALGLSLRSEGPVGLTFDSADAPAPAYANALLLLRPVSLFGNEPPLQEALAGVALRRYIDPAWLTGAVRKQESSAQPLLLDTSRCWWVDLASTSEPVSYQIATARPVPVFEMVRTAANGRDAAEGAASDRISINVWKAAIDGVAGHKQPTVEVARMDAGHADGLAFLHQQIAAGHYSTSILARPGSVGTERGDTDAPLMLCSFEWQVPRSKSEGELEEPPTDQPPPPVMLLVSAPEGNALARETMASATTALKWTQISRDFNKVNLLSADADGPAVAQQDAALLTARVEKNGKVVFTQSGSDEDVTLCASTARNRHSAHLQRHIALIASGFLEELGQPAELFSRATTVAGRSPMFPGMPSVPEQALRVVEFETPAAILCAQHVTASPRYRSAYIDFVSTDYRKPNKLLLTLRFTGRPEKSFTRVRLLVSQPTVGPDVHAPDRIECALDSERSPLALYSLLETDGTVTAWLDHADGKPSLLTKTRHTLELDGKSPGFFVRLETDPTNDELWVDLSCLHGPIGGEIRPDRQALAFDFNWLFSPLQADEPAALVSPAGLARMTEAQARIITVSPPIPIVRTSG
ncbi:hypothetical protein [Novosphingobium sp. AP12]|uniref:hypothetical protein n=1 Tax=Novosphingobium sp. AP12 TaxID=1144305 RepID=UPI001EE68A96|nr:hypothetical protein [Novosphingobium sp. AP12]